MADASTARLSCRAGIARAGVSRAGAVLSGTDKLPANTEEGGTQRENRWDYASETTATGWTVTDQPTT